MDQSFATPATEDADVDAALAHPAIVDGALALTRGILGLHRGNRLLNLIGNDRGRFVMVHMIFFLDADGELTTNRFKAVCSDAGACSPGRAGAMLALLRYVGFVSPAGPAQRGAPQLLKPSNGFVASQRERWRNLFAAVSMVSPMGAEAQTRIDDEAFFAAYARVMGQWGLDGGRAIDHAPDLEAVVERTGGLLLLLMLFEAADGQANTPVVLPVAAAARKLGVSRAHIARVFDLAEASGLMTRDAAGALAMTPRLRSAIVRLQGGNLGVSAGRIREALNLVLRQAA